MVCPLPYAGADRAAVAEHYGENASVVKLNVDDNPQPHNVTVSRDSDTDSFPRWKGSRARVGATSKESITRMIEKYVTAKAVS
jgi:hypothetical protein